MNPECLLSSPCRTSLETVDLISGSGSMFMRFEGTSGASPVSSFLSSIVTSEQDHEVRSRDRGDGRLCSLLLPQNGNMVVEGLRSVSGDKCAAQRRDGGPIAGGVLQASSWLCLPSCGPDSRKPTSGRLRSCISAGDAFTVFIFTSDSTCRISQWSA